MIFTNEQLIEHLNEERLDLSNTQIIEGILPLLSTLDLSTRQSVLQLLHRISTDRQIETTSKVSILKTLIGDAYLFFNIGSLESTDLLKRAASVQSIAAFVNDEATMALVDDALYEKMSHALLLYIDLEADVRSYVDDWYFVEPIRYAAQAILTLLRDPRFQAEDCKKVFRVLANKIVTSSTLYVGKEQDVLCETFLYLLSIHLDEKMIEDFFIRIPKFIQTQQSKLECKQIYYLKRNVYQFLTIFHVYLYRQNQYHSLLPSVDHCLEKTKWI